MQKILVVDDDAHIRDVVCFALRRAGFEPLTAANGRVALEVAARELPALVVLDILMPELDGTAVCTRLRAKSDLPVIFLTSKDEEMDRILGLELGADDYVVKPFSPRELVARVKAVLRRFERPLAPGPIMVGEIEIDPVAMTLAVSGKLVTTTATEFRLLDYFARHLGRVFTRDQLLDSVWRDTSYVTPRSVDVYVRRIREKIEPDPENPRYLKTVRGAGYRFEVPK